MLSLKTDRAYIPTVASLKVDFVYSDDADLKSISLYNVLQFIPYLLYSELDSSGSVKKLT